MKIYEFKNPNWGIAFTRISNALHDHSPNWVEWTINEDKADLRIIHVVGGGEIPELQKPGPKVIIQHCYFTASANEYNYDKYWEQAVLTSSFHNLPNYTNKKFNFHHMPWGASPEIFYRIPEIHKDFPIIATGHVSETECIDKVYEACKTLKLRMLHTGQNFLWDTKYYMYLPYITDKGFNELLNRCNYVSALRLIEGFELMAIEGLFCKARPIVPENSTYDWYREYGYTIDSKKDIVEQLKDILSQPPRIFTEEEYKIIVDKFAWKTIVPNFFTKIKGCL